MVAEYPDFVGMQKSRVLKKLKMSRQRVKVLEGSFVLLLKLY